MSTKVNEIRIDVIGYAGRGKSTIANKIQQVLEPYGIDVSVLDDGGASKRSYIGSDAAMFIEPELLPEAVERNLTALGSKALKVNIETIQINRNVLNQSDVKPVKTMSQKINEFSEKDKLNSFFIENALAYYIRDMLGKRREDFLKVTDECPLLPFTGNEWLEIAVELRKIIDEK